MPSWRIGFFQHYLPCLLGRTEDPTMRHNPISKRISGMRLPPVGGVEQGEDRY